MQSVVDDNVKLKFCGDLETLVPRLARIASHQHSAAAPQWRRESQELWHNISKGMITWLKRTTEVENPSSRSHETHYTETGSEHPRFFSYPLITLRVGGIRNNYGTRVSGCWKSTPTLASRHRRRQRLTSCYRGSLSAHASPTTIDEQDSE